MHHAAGRPCGAAHSCVSPRVSGLQEDSLLLQLLLRLWELLATWARGSQRMRYLRAGRGTLGVSATPMQGSQHVWLRAWRGGAGHVHAAQDGALTQCRGAPASCQAGG